MAFALGTRLLVAVKTANELGRLDNYVERASPVRACRTAESLKSDSLV
jgi:hypothetical protein